MEGHKHSSDYAPCYDTTIMPVRPVAKRRIASGRTRLIAVARGALAQAVAVQERCLPPLAPAIADLALCMVDALRTGGKVIWFGNGGSAAQAQHAAAELLGRFDLDRAPFASFSLTIDSPVLTALGNDYCYEEIFARQVQALARSGDLVIATAKEAEWAQL